MPVSVSTTGSSVTVSPLQSVTTTQLQSSANPSYPAPPVTFTASVSTRTAPVSTGFVSFVLGNNVLATVGVGGGGSASFTTTALALGSNAITAVYTGSGAILSSTSPMVTVSVVPYSTVTVLASSSNPSTFGRAITFTASVITNAGMAPTAGTVSFRRGRLLLGTVALSPSGTASLSLSSLAVGTLGIQAIYNGTANNLSSVSRVFKQTIGPASTETTLSVTTQILANGRIRYTLVASVATDGDSGLTPTGTVVFRENGRSVGTARLKAGVATLVVPGKGMAKAAKFVASYQKNSKFRSSSSPSMTVSA